MALGGLPGALFLRSRAFEKGAGYAVTAELVRWHIVVSGEPAIRRYGQKPRLSRFWSRANAVARRLLRPEPADRRFT